MRRVVVTGLGAVTPVGNGVEAMWESLAAGRRGIGKITRFDASGHKATLAAEVKDFDPLDCMDKGDARRSDLFTQYALASACQAMRDSGLDGKIEPERLGVYYGSGIGGMETISEEHLKLFGGGPRKVSPFFIPMMISNIAAGSIAIRFHAKASCLSVTTACSTGANAIGEAYRAIRHGYADAIIAGGSEAAITPIGVAGFTNMTAMSISADPEAAILPFDKRRNGFVMGDGAGALVLEEYERAAARDAVIYAEISGYGSTCDAHHITAPDPDAECPARAMAIAFEDSGARPGAVYVNAHGTGTQLNDVTETLAIKKAFGSRLSDVIVSSTKSMTGHMLGAAGAVEAVISILALRSGIIPPTAGLYEPDGKCDLDYTPVTARRAEIASSLSMSMGFGGHNACLCFTKV